MRNPLCLSMIFFKIWCSRMGIMLSGGAAFARAVGL
jgi:hypothetical protein